MRYRIALHQSDEGFSVSVPGLPGAGLKAPLNRKPLKISKTPFGNIARWSMNSFGMSRFVR